MKNEWKDKYYKALDENYNLRLDIDFYKEILGEILKSLETSCEFMEISK